MPRKIFVNLPVQDLQKTMDFFGRLGFTFNPQFTNEKAACMVIGDDVYAMLLREEFFKTFTQKDIADARKCTEVINALTANSRTEVDAFMEKALAAGAVEYRPAEDHGWMYSRAFQDLDGHQWEFFYMDIGKAPAKPE